jgi:hypothetical protein
MIGCGGPAGPPQPRVAARQGEAYPDQRQQDQPVGVKGVGAIPVTSNPACVPLAPSTAAAPVAAPPPGWSP